MKIPISLLSLITLFEPALAQSNQILQTGLLPPTPEQSEWMVKNMRAIKSIKTTQLGLDRINAAKRKKGRLEIRKSAVLSAPVGQDLETVNSASVQGKAIVGSGAPLGLQASDLPPSVDNSTTKWFPPVVTQKFNDCAQVSLVSYTYTYMTAMARDWDAKAGGNAVHFNSAWTYNMVNGGTQGGGWFAWSILQQNGCALMSDWPESNFKAWCTDGDVWRKAINFRAGDTIAVGGLDASANTTALNRVKTLLNSGYILNCPTGMATWRWLPVVNDPATANDDAWVGKNIIHFSYHIPGDTSGHALTVVGYNDDIWCDINANGQVDPGEKGALRICNSWGTSWEDNGFCWVAYDALKTVSDVPNYPPRYANRTPGGIFYGTVYGITARASYTPRVLAKVTLNAGKRNQINITNGFFMQNGSPQPAFSDCLKNQGGAYAFDGGYTAIDGTFCFDLSDVAPAGVSGSYYLDLRDSNSDGFATTLKEFAILDLEGGRQEPSIEVPASIDGTSRTFQLDYSREDKPLPTLNADEDVSAALAAVNFGYSAAPNPAFAEVEITSLPAKGSLKLDGVLVTTGQKVAAANIGKLTYQSAPNANGPIYATIGFKVKNASAIWSAPAVMTINVNPVNDAPTSAAASVNLNGSAVRTFTAGDFPFTDIDGDTLCAIKLITLPTKGTLKLNGTAISTVTDPKADVTLANIALLTYTADPSYTGSDSFTFKVSDGVLFSASAVTMGITGSRNIAVLTATSPTNSAMDYLSNSPGTIPNSVAAPLLNSLTIDTTAGSNIWDLAGKTATFTSGCLIMTGSNNSTIQNGILRSNSTSGLLVTQNGNGTLALSSVIANGVGNSTLTKAGTGPLTLAAANTYSGATTISGGILNLTNALALQNSALDTANSVLGSNTAGLKTTLTTLTLGGITGNKDLASVFTTALGGYSGLTTLNLNPSTSVTHSYGGNISGGTPGMSLIKTGLGTQTLSGTNSLTSATVNAGTLGITGGSLKLANGFVNVGSAAEPSIVKIDGGSLDVNSPFNNSGGLQVGHLKGTVGAIYLNSGSISSSSNWYNLHLGGVGKNNPSYGFLSITGGEIRGSQHRTRIGQYSGTGVWYQSGGSYSNASPSNWSGNIDIGSVVDTAADSNIGVVYLNNTAQFTSISPVNVASVPIGTSIGTLTVAGSAALNINHTLEVGAATGTTATVNLNGGTLTANAITNNATGTVNFNGGTLKAGRAGTLFSGNGAAYIYPSGATIDTQANTVTSAQALLAPAGSGVVTIPIASAGSGYIGAPYVSLAGSGIGATAVANMVDDGTGKGTYKVGSVTITCPGRGYTALSNAVLRGGLPTGGTAAVLDFAKAAFAINAGGGLTKIGTGTLTLTGNNTYLGTTTVNGGVLAVNGSSIVDSGKLVISGGKVNLTGAEKVNTLYFGATQQVAGTYNATNSSAYFTGTGTLIVTTGASAPRLVLGLGSTTYDSWASASGVTGAANADANQDGVPNGIAYFMSETGRITLPGIEGNTITWRNGGNIPSSAYGSQFFVETSSDLVTWTVVDADNNLNLSNSSGEVSYTIPSGSDKTFVRLKVTPN